MPRKKIVFVIVEGPSDEEALGVLLNRYFDSSTVYIHIMHCDITTELDVNPGNVVARIGNLVKIMPERHLSALVSVISFTSRIRMAHSFLMTPLWRILPPYM